MVTVHMPVLAFIRSSDAFVLKNDRPSSATTTIAYRRPLEHRYDYFLLNHSPRIFKVIRPTTRIQQRSADDIDDVTSKGIVSLLTDVVNSAFDTWSILFPRTTSLKALTETGTLYKNLNESIVALQQQQSPPSTPFELLERIRNDYTERNYLWTGDLDVEANFVESCRFTDPTLSFVGTDKYVKNIQNLRPILKLVTDVESECRSELIDIQLYDTYIQTRWNMIGTLSRLPWKPKIDVIGKTKFWYQNDTNQIYFYDEIWEIPANQALLQIVTPTNSKS
jgi:Uncharacterized conserved protein (DUF2358)